MPIKLVPKSAEIWKSAKVHRKNTIKGIKIKLILGLSIYNQGWICSFYEYNIYFLWKGHLTNFSGGFMLGNQKFWVKALQLSKLWKIRLS